MIKRATSSGSAVRKVRPGLEELEGRTLLTASPALMPPTPESAATTTATVRAARQAPQANAVSPLGALGGIIHTTKNAAQAPWVSRDFWQGRDLAEWRLAARLRAPAAVQAFRRIHRARVLIRAAVKLYDAPTTTFEQRAANHRLGNDYVVRAAKLMFRAESVWYQMYFKARYPGGQINAGISLSGSGAYTRVVFSWVPLDPRDR
jgi:hypothetical protein